MRGIIGLAGFALAFGVACDSPPSLEPAHETSLALGIDRFEVVKGANHATIIGLDGEGDEVARVDVTLGWFTSQDDLGEIYGRQMSVNVGGGTLFHESELSDLVTLPLGTRSAGVQAFLRDPVVSSELALWGITFSRPSTEPASPRDLDVAYTTVNSGPDTYVNNFCSYSGCDLSPYYECGEFNPDAESGGEIGEYRCCPSGPLGAVAAERRCLSANAYTSCGTAGPAGCKVCWTESYNFSCGIWVEEHDSSITFAWN